MCHCLWASYKSCGAAASGQLSFVGGGLVACWQSHSLRIALPPQAFFSHCTAETDTAAARRCVCFVQDHFSSYPSYLAQGCWFKTPALCKAPQLHVYCICFAAE